LNDYISSMKGAVMNKTVDNTSFVYGPQKTNAKLGPYGTVIAIAFIVMLLAIYIP